MTTHETSPESSLSKTNDSETSLLFYQGKLRAPWKILLFIFFFVISEILTLVIVQVVPILRMHFFSYTVSVYVAGLIATIVMHRAIEKRPFIEVGMRFDRATIRHLAFGGLAAAAMIVIVVAIEFVFGMVRIESGVISLGYSASLVAEGLGIFLIVGFGEELLCRGYCFQALLRGTKKSVAVVLTALVFSAMHSFNPNIELLALLNIALAGVVFALAYLRTNRLWLPIGMHVGWNAMQGTVFGFPVSGISNRSLFLSIETGPDWLTGGMFGPEGGAIVSLVLIGTIMLAMHPRVIASLRDALKISEQPLA